MTIRNNRNVRQRRGSWWSRWADQHICIYARKHHRYVRPA
jgi:hypothetical protein